MGGTEVVNEDPNEVVNMRIGEFIKQGFRCTTEESKGKDEAYALSANHIRAQEKKRKLDR